MRALSILLVLAVACKDGGDDPVDSEIIGGDDSAEPADSDGDGVPDDEDCDPDDASVYPGATELCDGLDNNCDDVVDEGVTITVYADADADGYGDDATATQACAPEDGQVEQGGDCDDSDPAYNPAAVEDDCADPNDYNCDGSTGYADADGDGWAACQECDDADDAVNPDATEVCNDLDDDCDGLVDDADEDLDLSTATESFADVDGDGYGDPDASTLSCDVPSSNVSDSSDCDDADADTFPGAAPNDSATACMSDHDADDWGDDSPGDGVSAGTDCDDSAASTYPGAADAWYDGVDADCAGDNDYDADADGYESEAYGGDDCDDSAASTYPGATDAWYDGVDADCAGDSDYDADADGYDSDGYSGDDCDDADASVYPGAAEDGGDGSETGDGLDNDCDGYEDEGLLYGSGGDGALSVTADASLDDHGGGCAAVTALGSATATLDDASSFSTGDVALLVNLQGSGSGSTNLGAWERLDVASVSGSTLTFVEPLSGTYGESSNSDLSGQTVALFRVPQFTDVSVSSSVTLTAGGWDGGCGGVLAFLATGAVTVDGALSADALGYAGGAQNNSHETTGQQGESYQGTGSKTNVRNLGGGGGGGDPTSACNNCEGTGGGGGHGEDGEAGEQANPSLGDGGEGGAAYGDGSLAALTVGSGGGAGALDGASEGGVGGHGGAGGGALLVYASSLSVSGSVSALGEDGEIGCAEFSNWCGTGGGSQPSEAEPGGGGAGGAIYLISDSLAVTGSVDASGGLGQLSGSSWQRVSGDGGAGLIRLDFNTLNGYASGTSGAQSEAEGVCEPDPGTLGTP
ncbi:MAG: putative metal-binding motif-containing protein [Alphaproteobacteria bacterium]|nr:putative metal-binding motif-containing protein [Alphaproteobacteria bacterium]